MREAIKLKGETGIWEMVIGLEIHAQVNCKSKLFSGSATDFGASPNSQVSFVDAAMPGMLPVINNEAVNQAIKTGHAYYGYYSSELNGKDCLISTIDSDGDGYSNQDETTAGTDPLDDQSYPEDFKSDNFNILITDFFSPNGDGNGDTWQIKEVERYPKSRVWIFTRAGKKIFSANPYLNNWNGEFNGSPLPVGSYYYRLDLDGNNNIDFEGWVYLHR